MKKGIVDINMWILIGAMILCATLILSAMSLKFGSIKKFTEDLSIREDKYTMVYAMDVAKLYVDTAIKYSIYQSCYDKLKNAGKLKSENEFKSTLLESIKTNLEAYLSDYNFLEIYSVRFPEYKINMKIDDNRIILNLKSDKNIVIEKTKEVKDVLREKIVLERESSMQKTVNTNCFGIYKRGLNLESEIKGKLERVILDNVNFESKYSLAYSDSEPDCKYVFEESVGETVEEIKNRLGEVLRNEVQKMHVNKLGNFDVEIEFQKFDFDVKENGSAVKFAEQNEKECSYTYISKAVVLVTIEDKEKVPIWNGKTIAFEPLRFVFQVST